MDKTTIHNFIDKVIGKKGLLRIPSWWMRKVLMQIADWVQEGDDANDKKIEKAKKETEKLLNLTLPYMLVSGTGIVYIDGNKISFTNADKQLIYITGAITFYYEASSQQITYIYIPHLDIRSQGRDMSYMFFGCSNLNSLDLSGFNTSAITNMSCMFRGCSNLTSLDLSSFDTSAVTDMSYMFHDCKKLTSLDLSSFDTSAVTNMWYMFGMCSNLTSLDLSSFDTSAVTNMRDMFGSCKKLTSLDLSSFNTSAVTNMGDMFGMCSNLTSLDLSSFDTSAVTNMWDMFRETFNITSLILGPNFFKTSNITRIDLSHLNKWTNDTVVTSLVTNSYDRAAAGLSAMTLQLSANTKAALTDEQKAAITAKGYTIA